MAEKLDPLDFGLVVFSFQLAGFCFHFPPVFVFTVVLCLTVFLSTMLHIYSGGPI